MWPAVGKVGLAMRDVLSWNLNLGRWAGVQIRLHVLFALLAVFLLHAAVRQEHWPSWYAGAILGILLASALLHELAHSLTDRRLGGRGDLILLWPLGGLAHATHQDARSDLIVAAAGPLASLALSVAIWPAIVIHGAADWSLLNPLALPVEDSWLGGLKLALWLNWLLAVVNLLPAYPLDGGRLLRAGLTVGLGPKGAAVLTVRIAQVTALGLWVGAWFAYEGQSPQATAALILLGVLVFFGSRQEARVPEPDREEGPFGYDFSQGYTSLERAFDQPRPESSPMRRWLAERREARQLRQRQIEADEEQRVDDILARLHICGLQGLSPEDRALLDRVSARYRSRQQQ
jgi:Zn-dependent protease